MKNKIKLLPQLTMQRLVAPKNLDEDIARREYIFNILMLGFLLLTLSAFITSLIRSLSNVDTSQYVPTPLLLIPVVMLFFLYWLSRKQFNNRLVYVFIAFVALLGTYSLHKYGYILQQGLLVYVLVIIMSGILISAKASVFIATLIFTSLIVMAGVQIQQKTDPYVIESSEPLNVENLIVYVFIFMVIFLVSWLSNRDIEASLLRARRSEKELLTERDKLEITVRSRTKELEKAQVEKSMELYRFAEFGRISSSFLHDLANPLTAVSLNLDQLSVGRESRVVNQVRQSVNHMEQYVQSARRQLRSQSDITILDTKYEIEKVKNFLVSKARHHKVKLSCRLTVEAIILGDSAKFSQVVANLIANAIDSYNGTDIKNKRTVFISTKTNSQRNIIIISVKDSGVGITNDELDRIFNPFFTTKSSDRGTGIGLTITKRIVEEDFKGVIRVESGKTGTTFFVELPLYPKG